MSGKRISDASPDRILIMRKGASFTLPLNESSRYDGLTFYYQKNNHINPIKILDRLQIDEHSKLEQVHIKPSSALLIY